MKVTLMRIASGVAVAGVGVLAFLFTQFGSHAQNVRLVAPSTPVPATFFGMHMHRVITTTPWPSVPFGSWRLWDSQCHWSQMQPRKGQWRWEVLDREVELAEKHNVDLLMTLGDTPTWASARPSEPRNGRFQETGGAAEPRDIEDWRNYVRTLATRYKGRIHYYEIWNEPNLPNFFSGTPEKMIELAREAYPILKQVDPTNQVVSPSAVGPTGLTWFDRYMELGGGKYADIIGFHFYVHLLPPETMLQLINPLKQSMKKYGVDDKPLWNTETGWLRTPNQMREIDPAHQAPGWTARAFIVAWAAGVQRFYWYAWDDDGGDSIPFTEFDQSTATRNARAFVEVQKWMTGSRMESCEAQAENVVCKMTRESGRPAWIVWNRTHSAQFDVPKDWGVQTAWRLSGDQSPFSGNRIEIDELPIMLEGQAGRS